MYVIRDKLIGSFYCGNRYNIRARDAWTAKIERARTFSTVSNAKNANAFFPGHTHGRGRDPEVREVRVELVPE